MFNNVKELCILGAALALALNEEDYISYLEKIGCYNFAHDLMDNIGKQIDILAALNELVSD